MQEPLGHKDVTTTMIYTHVLNRGPAAVRSPADRLALVHTPAPPAPAGYRPAEIGCRRPQPIPVSSSAPRGRGGFTAKGIAAKPMARRTEIDCSTLQP